jgi:hypothetical protein
MRPCRPSHTVHPVCEVYPAKDSRCLSGRKATYGLPLFQLLKPFSLGHKMITVDFRILKFGSLLQGVVSVLSSLVTREAKEKADLWGDLHTQLSR